MIAIIAWRNIWRSVVRSLVLIGAIASGVWALIILIALSEGMIRSYVSRSIENRTSHIQIHHPNWMQDKELTYSFDAQEVRQVLDQDPDILAYTERIVISGMLQSPRSARSIFLTGIDPEKENAVTHLSKNILEGRMLSPDDKNAIVISRSSANHLKLNLKNKLIVSFQDAEGHIASAALKVVGIYSINDIQYEDQYAFLNASTLQSLAILEDGVIQETAILLQDFNQIEKNKASLQASLPAVSVQDYGEISPEIKLYNSSLSMTVNIMTTIVMLALIFGIINTMLMAILEREHELGMLRAVGMKRISVFTMVVLETILLSFCGLPLGMFLGWGSIQLLSINGINLAKWSAGLSQFGMSNMLYPELSTSTYYVIVLAILITAILASIYPAIKAVSLKPLQAIQRK